MIETSVGELLVNGVFAKQVAIKRVGRLWCRSIPMTCSPSISGDSRF
jgi:hypothetical protein